MSIPISMIWSLASFFFFFFSFSQFRFGSRFDSTCVAPDIRDQLFIENSVRFGPFQPLRGIAKDPPAF
jgi:hypothetical protein